MWISEFWYEKLPAIYAAGGALALLGFGPRSPALLSALMLFGAAALTHGWRRSYRAGSSFGASGV